ncbi:amidase [Marinobacter psychrophilus]|jgi:aspartyl-tRNA(Asn)/glutamyl-tRNA(Gln) amidotransferase subunit A|uniref:amidase n=1 Tax=Marinobacter psychrophilus TaxID=330734 RepID=UPI001B3E65D1|nr:amidase [Marinobacter psychrophilus]MBQ0764670.1 amidase [Marinobacter psychrophilus]MBQ0843338.1 amidase [Marinobacter psychrophilus]
MGQQGNLTAGQPPGTTQPPALHLLRARDIAKLISSGMLSAVDLIDYLVKRINTIDPYLGAMVDVDLDGALAQAEQADQLAAAGSRLPLLGVPFTVKDNLWVEQRPATCGSKLFADFIAPQDSWSVTRLKAAGAICIGTTNCSEFGCKGVTSNLVHGVTRNPWCLDLTPGGSSGGAVASVAAGFSPIALSTDAGGSTRRPAAHTGLIGFKCTSGLIPNPWGFDEPCRDMGSIGVLARDVIDCAAMMDVLAGYDPRDPLSHPLPTEMTLPSAFTRAVINTPDKSLRIAWSLDLGCGFAVDNDVASEMLLAVAQLRSAGWKIDDASPHWSNDVISYPYAVRQQAELATLFGTKWHDDPAQFDPVIAAQIQNGLAITATELADVTFRRHRARAQLTAFFECYDLLLCPTVPVEPWPCDSLAPGTINGQSADPRAHAVFTPLFNLCDVPALSVPCGFGARGLPVALQVVGPRYTDLHVLQFGAEIEHLLSRDFNAPMMRTNIFEQV